MILKKQSLTNVLRVIIEIIFVEMIIYYLDEIINHPVKLILNDNQYTDATIWVDNYNSSHLMNSSSILIVLILVAEWVSRFKNRTDRTFIEKYVYIFLIFIIFIFSTYVSRNFLHGIPDSFLIFDLNW